MDTGQGFRRGDGFLFFYVLRLCLRIVYFYIGFYFKNWEKKINTGWRF